MAVYIGDAIKRLPSKMMDGLYKETDMDAKDKMDVGQIYVLSIVRPTNTYCETYYHTFPVAIKETYKRVLIFASQMSDSRLLQD
jgi:hypothetical protein